MRRFLLALLCCVVLSSAVFASNRASTVQNTATVNADGSCQVTLIAVIHLDSSNSSLKFPLPSNAKNIRVNNGWSGSRRSGGVRTVSLSKFVGESVGDFTVTVSYTLPAVVRLEKEIGQVMTLPLLSGFEYPVDQLDFSVTLPGPFPTKPTFSSGYYQESIESSISYKINGNTISGYVSGRLQDHETLAMRLVVPDGVFDQSVTSVHDTGPYKIIMIMLTLLALIYWLLTLRSLPLRRIRCTVAPNGITAGELGSRLVHKGADLTMMVISWAQLGYLLITMDENGRVFLHKRMDMGNERSAFENHYFKNIFRRSSVVDGTSYRYAKLCQKAAGEVPGAKADFRPGAGNPKIFRILCAGVGAAAGGALGGAMVSAFAWRIILTILMTAAGGAASWQIQKGFMLLHLKSRQSLLMALGITVFWILLNLISGQWSIMIAALLVQAAGGLACAYGGRRSELGRQTAGEILGLRHYLRTVSREELQRIQKTNSDFYYEMAPYALALGVDNAFAAAFGSMRLPNCSYLITGIETDRSAGEWYLLLRDVAEALNARQKRLKFERFTR